LHSDICIDDKNNKDVTLKNITLDDITLRAYPKNYLSVDDYPA
jgi:hypothetical protein